MEKIIGFLGEVSGHTYDSLYDLLFTTEKILVLIVQHPSDEPIKLGLGELLLGGKLARERKILDRKKTPEERLQAYKEKTFDELLAAHRFNYEIPFHLIETVEITRGLFQTRVKFHTAGSSLAGRTSHFTLSKNQTSQAQDLLALVFPNKFKK